MIAVEERFLQMLPQNLPGVPDDEVQYVINILVKWNKPERPVKKHKARDNLQRFADPSKIPGEEGALMVVFSTAISPILLYVFVQVFIDFNAILDHNVTEVWKPTVTYKMID